MFFILPHSDHSVDRQRDVRTRYSDNGLLHSELTDPALVDSVAQTVRVNKKVPVAVQEHHDFTEFVTDAGDVRVTMEDVVDLAALPLSWTLTMTGAWNVEQGSAATSVPPVAEAARLTPGAARGEVAPS
jgi:hypothetical protein